MILLDTHVVVWLYADPQRLVPDRVQDRLNSEQLALSPFVRLELEYLYEVGRVAVPAHAMVDDLVPKLELSLTDPPSGLVCQVATTLSWTRDPFDRLISAQAVATGVTLVTKDHSILRNLPLAWWPSNQAGEAVYGSAASQHQLTAAGATRPPLTPNCRMSAMSSPELERI